MNQKKKQSIVAVVATVLTVTCVMSPVASVYAREKDKIITQQNEATEIKLNSKNTVVPIDEDTFPNDTFREYVKTNFDTEPDNELTTEEIAKVTRIDLGNEISVTDLTGIEHFTALEVLYCHGTGISSLDVSNNKKLVRLDCDETRIEKLDISKNKALTSLDCDETRIESLNVSENEALEYLSCSNTRIKKLDVSNNKALTYLDCSNTGITSLDVSNNKYLQWLHCPNTGISGLDVSNNEQLGILNCSNTPLAYLNLGADRYIQELFINDLQPVDIEVPVDTFNITDIFPGILTDKIKIKSGADYSNGVMSNYTLGTKITYTYDCGIVNGTQLIIEVSLLPMGKSTISITDNLNKTYDGTAVSPEVKKEGSSGAVSYKWERKKNPNDWEDIASAPTDAGTYRVTVIVASDNKYKGATSEPKEFTISQATNSWTDTLSITGWTYNETANNPTAIAKFGTVDYLYSGSKNGTYTDVVPTNAGTWYVKASVAETENYTGLETILAFKIEAKNVENNKITVSDIKNDKDIENLVVKDEDKVLEKGIDYEVEKKQKDNKVEVVITFKGNYTGTITKSYTANSVSAGDTTSVVLWSTILAFSAVLVVFLKRKKYKEQTEE